MKQQQQQEENLSAADVAAVSSASARSLTAPSSTTPLDLIWGGKDGAILTWGWRGTSDLDFGDDGGIGAIWGIVDNGHNLFFRAQAHAF